jgi:hypothetical protein
VYVYVGGERGSLGCVCVKCVYLHEAERTKEGILFLMVASCTTSAYDVCYPAYTITGGGE